MGTLRKCGRSGSNANKFWQIAGAFYGFKVILIPHNLGSEVLSTYLKKTEAEILIAVAGALDLDVVANQNKRVSHVIYVAQLGSRHMVWDQLPPGVRDDLKLTTWSGLVEERRNIAGLDVPEWDPKSPSPPLTMLNPLSPENAPEFVDYQPEVGSFFFFFFFFFFGDYTYIRYRGVDN